MVAGLVAVRVLTDQSGNVGRCTRQLLGTGGEKSVELARECLASTKQRHVAVEVVLVEEGRLPCIGFGEVVPRLPVPEGTRIEGHRPRPIGETRLHEAAVMVEHVAVVARAITQHAVVVVGAGSLGELRDGPVVVGVLERLARRFPFLVAGHIAQAAIVGQAAIIVVHGAFTEQRPCACIVDAGEPLRLRLGQHHRRVVADHAAGFDALQRPDRSAVGTFGRHADQTVDQAGHAMRLHEREQGMQGTIGVPQGVCGERLLP